MKKIIYLFITLFTVFSCDNRGFEEDVDIQNAFPFEFNVDANPNYYLNSIGKINLEIKNEHEVTSQEYKITYTITGGESEIFYKGEVNKGELKMNKGAEILDFKGLKKGTYKIIFLASNGKKKYDITKEISIEVINKPFEANVKADAEVYRSETNEVIINVKVDNPNWVKYSWSWTSQQDNELKNLDGTIIGKESLLDIDPNKDYQFIFNPKENVGTHILYFTFKDTQNQEITLDLKIDVKEIDFTTILEPVRKEIYFDEIANLEFSLTPEFISKNNPNIYKVTYSFDGTEGVLNIDGKKIGNKETLTLENVPFEKKIITFEPISYGGSAKINLEIEDKYGYKKTISTDINIQLREYEVFSKRLTTDYLYPNEKGADFSLELRTLANVSKMKYKVRLISDSNDKGYFIFNGNRIEYNEDFYLTDNFQNITYYATDYGTGKHQVSFQIKDITNQSPKNQVKVIEFLIDKKLKINAVSLTRKNETKKGPAGAGNDFKYTYLINRASLDLGIDEKITEISFGGINRNGNYETKTSEKVSLDEDFSNITIWIEDWQRKPRPTFDKMASVYTVIFKTSRGRTVQADNVSMKEIN